MYFPPFSEKDSRFERKYVVTEMHKAGVMQQIRMHPSAFSNLFQPRQINNIYLDSEEMSFFTDNVSGKGSRKKARIRWYGNLFGEIQNPVLEFKIREGMLGNKRSFSLSPFTLDESFNGQKLREVFHSSALPDWAKEVMLMLRPALLNTYQRCYFLSFDNKFRITLDDHLNYYRIGMQNGYFFEKYSSDDLIVELKYKKEDDTAAIPVSNALPFRLSKSSKYVNGFELLHPELT